MLSDDEIRAVLIAESRIMAQQAGENLDDMIVDEGGLSQVVLISRAVERAAYERAAKECENRSGPIEIYNRAYPHYLECAAAIRALGGQHD